MWTLKLQNDFTLVCLCLCVPLIAYYLHWRSSRKHMYTLAKLVPSPKNLKELPFVGNTFAFYGGTEKIMTVFFKIARSSIEPMKVWMGPYLFVIIQRAEDVETVFNSQYALSKHEIYDFGKNVIGEGLLISNGRVWKRHRKIILPAFNQKILDAFVPIFVEQIVILMKILATKTGVWMDITTPITNCTLDMLCETVLGVKMNTQTRENKVGYSIHRAAELLSKRAFNVMYHPNILYKLTGTYREEKDVTKYFHKFTLEVINKKRLELKQKQSCIQNGGMKAFLDLLLEPTKDDHRFTDEELRDEVATSLLAGIDTSATVTCFTLILLAMHPEIQDKVHEEAVSILGYDRDIQCEDLSQFIYLERVIKEAMRLFPVAPIVARQAEGDIQLESCTLPKGCGVILLTCGTHRSPEYYPDPLKFDPNRFLPDEAIKRHPYAYYPFTGGIRKCIGPKYGMMSVKVMVASFIRKFIVETKYKSVDEVRLKWAVVIKTVKGFPIKFKERTYK